jgi:HSP20 family protein
VGLETTADGQANRDNPFHPPPKTMTNALTRWNPVRELEEFQNRILGAFNFPRRGGTGDGQDSMASEWMPVVDITEKEKEYVITAELPQVMKENVKVTVAGGMLTISGERRFEKEEKTTYHRIERSYGSFVRSFAMPDDGDPSGVNAEFKDGILTIHLRKSESALPKQIEVKVK